MPYRFPATGASCRPRRSCIAISTVVLSLLGAACGGADTTAETTANDAADEAAVAETLEHTPGEPIDVLLASAGDYATPAEAAAAAGAGTPPQDDPERATIQATTVPNCEKVPASVSTSFTRRVTDFGAKPGDSTDDTAAIQKAMDAMSSGQTLIFPAGRYLINKSLHVRHPGVIFKGESGAILHATNPDSMAILIEQDRTTIQGLTFTAITTKRRTSAWHSRIAVAAGNPDGTWRWVYDTVIRDNKILPSGDPGTPGANSASTAGVLMVRADRFLIANNTISRTLSDGIHITNGSRNGRILNNIVRETGDDMIAIVSYANSGNPALNKASMLLPDWQKRLDERMDKNIVIAGNSVSGQYWGRGISVVGGEKITIARNTVDNVPLSAGILLAREANYESMGTTNVMVDSNTIRNIQTMSPPYDPLGVYSPTKRMGHGAVEIHASQFDDEAANSTLRSTLTVRNVMVRNNTVERTTVSGVRMGVGGRKYLGAYNSTGTLVTRYYSGAAIQAPSIEIGRFNYVNQEPLSVQSDDLKASGVHCSGNLRDGSTYQPSVCRTTAPVVTGATMTCTTDGKLTY